MDQGDLEKGYGSMNVLVLGGTGYLGYNIVKRLRKSGHDVTCVVRDTSDISELQKLGGITFISSNLSQIRLSLRQEKYDWIINGVCSYTPNETLYGDMLESNVMFPLGVLNLAVRFGIQNFLTMGTSLPSGLNVYSFTKNMFSEFGKFLCDKDGINFTELRLEMFYGGEFEPDNRFIKSSVLKLINGETLDLTEGTQKRDVVCVEDIVEIVNRLLERTELCEGYKVFPVGSGEQHSIREIIMFMKEQCNSDSVLNFGAIPERKGEPDTLADISWYSEIDYELKYSFYEGLSKECRSAVPEPAGSLTL